ncbi:hypothetical protein AHAS_Ahas09G0177800 [Arachis hypogaea]
MKIAVVESRKYFCNKWRGRGRIQGVCCITGITNQQGHLSRILKTAQQEFLKNIRGGSLIIAMTIQQR